VIRYIDRITGEVKTEKVFGDFAIRLTYESPFGVLLRPLIAKWAFPSKIYAWMQKRHASRKKIAPFIEKFEVDAHEFEKKPETFTSFNDFFIRKLKKNARPITEAPACIPADGRYWFFPNIESADHFFIKENRFSLETLLQDKKLAKEYSGGSMAIARLCPSDYHRFHFPFDCTPEKPHPVNGPLFSVNPLAVRWNPSILFENNRVVTPCETKEFGKVLFIEVGATFVGSIHQTYTPGLSVKKGEEKGYFSFGGSALVLLFKPQSVQFDQDLVKATRQGLEALCLMGQSMGKPPLMPIKENQCVN